ncbi:MAG: hypothetical protein Q9160_003640 [Pyrenula sp. 1 TL-2023]
MRSQRQKSKRQPVRLRHRIEKASAAKQRKQRKAAKSDPQWKSRLKKDPGIPNLFPFKDKILQEIEDKKQLKAEESARLREESRQRQRNATVDPSKGDMEADGGEETDSVIDEEMDTDGPSNPMAALLASAQARAVEFEDDDDDEKIVSQGSAEEDDDLDGNAKMYISSVDPESGKPVSYLHAESSRRAFDKVFKEIVSTADVILYVLDARDPPGTRSREVEREVMAADSGSKRLILLLNKCDLVPPTVLKSWLSHLRHYFPTIPIQASTSTSNASTFNHKHLSAKRSSETLLRALKAYAHTQAPSRSVTVGIIGYPNVGKSSIINSLISKFHRGTHSACPTGAEAGVTTAIREVKLDNKLKLLDSPGIVFPAEAALQPQSDLQSRLILLNALPPKQITDPIPAVTLLLQRLSASSGLIDKLLNMYGCLAPAPTSDGDVTTDFLVQVARKRGRLGKGGIPNIYAAAMTVITDWRDGRVQGWVEPVTSQQPVKSDGNNDLDGEARLSHYASDQKEVVTEWAKEFKLDGLWGDGQTGSDEE